MTSKKVLIALMAVVLTVGFAVVATTVFAAPLADGTILSIAPGNVPDNDSSAPCTEGSCFSMELSPTKTIWTNIKPGIDGGIIIGKDQEPGGSKGSGAATTPGEITAVWEFFNSTGDNSTAAFEADNNGSAPGGIITRVETDSSANVFDFESCSGADGCEGKTVLGSWHVAWNGIAIPMGSGTGCLGTNPSKCEGVTEWKLNPSPGSEALQSTFYLRHAWPVPDGDPSGFGNVPYSVILRGTLGPPFPPTPILMLPANNGEGMGVSLEFRWSKNETNTETYYFYNCADDPTASCTPVEISAEETAQLNNNSMFYAGGGGLLLIGMTFFGGLRGRKMMVLLFVIAVLFTGGALASCSNSKTGNTSISPLPLPADQISHTVTGLSSGTTYYWRVVAESDKGLTSASDIKQYTTE